MQNMLTIIEDALLAAADSDEKDTATWQSVVVDLAARLYALTGFDRDAISGYVWSPSDVYPDFVRAVARTLDAGASGPFPA